MNLTVGAFALDALVEGDHREPAKAELVAPRVVRAIRYYLHETQSERPGWRYPSFLDREESGKQEGEPINLVLDIDPAAWSDFESVAERQGVATERLAEHAVLYFVADRDAGRVTQRILADLEGE